MSLRFSRFGCDLIDDRSRTSASIRTRPIVLSLPQFSFEDSYALAREELLVGILILARLQELFVVFDRLFPLLQLVQRGRAHVEMPSHFGMERSNLIQGFQSLRRLLHQAQRCGQLAP